MELSVKSSDKMAFELSFYPQKVPSKAKSSPEQTDTFCQVILGTLLTDAIKKNFYSSSKKIVNIGLNGFMRPGNVLG